MKVKRIHLITQHFYPDMVSTGLHMTELMSRLSELDTINEYYVYCCKSARKGFSEELSLYSLGNIKKVTRVDFWGSMHGSFIKRIVFGFSFSIKTVLYLIRKRQKIDLIILTTNPPFLAAVAFLISKLLQKKYIIIVYDVYPEIVARLGLISAKGFVYKISMFFSNLSLKNSLGAVVIGEDMKSLLVKRGLNEKHVNFRLIRNWANKRSIVTIHDDNNLFLKENPQFIGKKILLYSGTMGTTHNVEDIIYLAEAMKEDTDFHFLFVGNGAKKKLIEEASNRLQNLTYLPFQPFEMVKHVLSACILSFVCLGDEFVGLSVPSKTYGIMAAGKPVVGILNENSEIGVTINNFKCGINLKSPITKEEFEIFYNFITDDNILIEYGVNARNAFLEHFDLDISVNKYKELVNEA